MPPKHKLTTLGWLKHLQDRAFPWFEWQYLQVLHKFLKDDWYLIQGGDEETTMKKWMEILAVLEVDKKAMTSLFLLAQDGRVGRGHANHIMWTILSKYAVDPAYQDLSNIIVHLINKHRLDYDRPPREHKDLKWWSWTCYERLYSKDSAFAPDQVPRGRWYIREGPGDLPLPPPQCWGTFPGVHQ